ncbi:hypothetical protein ACWD3K_35945 [Streptomyces sp. NPDC002778]
MLIYGLIPKVNQGAIVYPSLPQAPAAGVVSRPSSASSAAAVYGRRTGK